VEETKKKKRKEIISFFSIGFLFLHFFELCVIYVVNLIIVCFPFLISIVLFAVR